jgi:hypothetical protein
LLGARPGEDFMEQLVGFHAPQDSKRVGRRKPGIRPA